MAKFDDLSWMRFGRLTVTPTRETHNTRTRWICQCDCGSEGKFIDGSSLKNGHTVSCGCRMRETIAERVRLNTTHGQSAKGGTKAYHSYNQMKSRCGDTNNPAYKDYGGRGIKVCKRWLASFDNFYADMGDCPPGMSIERINNSKGYTPGNCKWASKKDQANNRRPKSERWDKYAVEFNGHFKSIREWSQITGIKYGTIWMRLEQGWSAKDALTLPTRPRRNLSHSDDPPPTC